MLRDKWIQDWKGVNERAGVNYSLHLRSQVIRQFIEREVSMDRDEVRLMENYKFVRCVNENALLQRDRIGQRMIAVSHPI